MSYPNPFFPEYSFRKRNYSTYTVNLDSSLNTVIFLPKADLLDILSTDADISKVYVSINDNTAFVPLSSIIPVITAISVIYLKWDSSQAGKYITFLIGYELFRTSKNTVSIVQSLINVPVNIAQSSINVPVKQVQPSTLNSAQIVIDNSGGSSTLVRQLFTSSTPSLNATIYLPSSVNTSTIYIGSSSSQVFPLEVGGSIRTNVSDLRNIYVSVPAGVKATIYVLWEV